MMVSHILSKLLMLTVVMLYKHICAYQKQITLSGNKLTDVNVRDTTGGARYTVGGLQPIVGQSMQELPLLGQTAAILI
jgi:hypothetical protein